MALIGAALGATALFSSSDCNPHSSLFICCYACMPVKICSAWFQYVWVPNEATIVRILSLTNGSCWQDTWRAISGGDVLQDGGGVACGLPNANAAQKPRNQPTLPFKLFKILYIFDISCRRPLAAMAKNRKTNTWTPDIASDSRRDAAFGYAAEALCSLPRRCSWSGDTHRGPFPWCSADSVSQNLQKSLDCVNHVIHNPFARLPCPMLVLCPLCPAQAWMYTIWLGRYSWNSVPWLGSRTSEGFRMFSMDLWLL